VRLLLHPHMVFRQSYRHPHNWRRFQVHTPCFCAFARKFVDLFLRVVELSAPTCLVTFRANDAVPRDSQPRSAAGNEVSLVSPGVSQPWLWRLGGSPEGQRSSLYASTSLTNESSSAFTPSIGLVRIRSSSPSRRDSSKFIKFGRGGGIVDLSLREVFLRILQDVTIWNLRKC